MQRNRANLLIGDELETPQLAVLDKNKEKWALWLLGS